MQQAACTIVVLCTNSVFWNSDRPRSFYHSRNKRQQATAQYRYTGRLLVQAVARCASSNSKNMKKGRDRRRQAAAQYRSTGRWMVQVVVNSASSNSKNMKKSSQTNYSRGRSDGHITVWTHRQTDFLLKVFWTLHSSSLEHKPFLKRSVLI